jgi:hypothetical protein
MQDEIEEEGEEATSKHHKNRQKKTKKIEQLGH